MELILEQFDDLLVKILLLAAIISFVSMLATAEMSASAVLLSGNAPTSIERSKLWTAFEAKIGYCRHLAEVA